jgi:WD40 repeat protein/serine/threonine protein kinase
MLGDFVLRDRLGVGGFGAIYRADQTLLGREAVVKVLHRREMGAESVVPRFLREARLASKLDHPYAAHVYAFGAETDGTLWIAMEFVRGTPLDALLKAQGPVPLSKFVPFLERLCEVVHSAHEQGIVHRDLKPANVMVLARAGRILPKLLDLGIARLAQGDEAPRVANPAELKEGDWLERVSESTLVEAESLSLTQQGSLIGSPRYMAPEQWLHAGSADSRADIYALGILAYESITGRLPFDGSTVRAIARQHASKALPPVGGELPPALDEVLGRACAKKAQERYSSALEFAQAFKKAAAVDQEDVPIPRLSETIRDEMIAAAPQPLAEAVAALDASRSSRQAIDAVSQTVRVASRFLGAMALGTRAAMGSGHRADREGVRDALQALVRGRLDDRGWFGLSCELCRPFAFLRDACPVPELVSLFFGPGGDGPGQAASCLEFFTGEWPALAAGDARSDSAAVLQRGLTELEKLLGALSFLFEYTLVARGRGPPEVWMGARRLRHAGAMVRGDPLREGEVALLTKGGHVALTLFPLAQVMSPTPGSEEEIFLLEGNGRHGAKLTAPLLGYERYDEGIWDWFRSHIASLDDAIGEVTGQEEAPYRGLSSFTARDSANYFGREREAEAFANRLRARPFLAVVGPSGSGKSSFVQAGVAPLLPDWRIVTFRPGPSPLSALVAALEQAGIPASDLLVRLPSRPALLGQRLAESAGPAGRLLLVVDQFEELVTLCLDPESRRVFAQALVDASSEGSSPVRVILTLRDDFLIRCQQLSPLRDRLGPGLQLLGTPAPEDLQRIVEEPARRQGFAFDDPTLTRDMVTAVQDQPGALALLSFTASRLWDLRDRGFKRLTRRAYAALGGVGGALAQHAEATLAQMSNDEQRLTREAFRALVTAEGTRAVLSKRDLVEILGGAPAAESTLERLIGARLLVSERGGETDRIEVIHETLLLSWPRLVKWQREDAEGARMRDQLRAATRQWDERGRSRGVLWRGDALMEYRLWSTRYAGGMTDKERGFVQASMREETRGKRLRTGVLVSAFAVLCIGMALLIRTNRKAERSALEARTNLAAMHAEQGRQSFLSGQPLQALPYLAKAYEEGVANAGMQYMLGRAMSMATSRRFSLEGHSAPLYGAELSRDGRWAATVLRDGPAFLWDARTGERVATLELAAGSLAFSADGQRLLSGGKDHSARVWEVPSGRTIAVLQGHGDEVRSVQFSADGQRILTAGFDGTARLWTADGKALRTMRVGAGTVKAVFSPDGARIATCGSITDTVGDPVVRLWDAGAGSVLFELHGHAALVGAESFTPDGSRLVTGSIDGTVRVWDVASGKSLLVLEGHGGPVLQVAVGPDGRELASASRDGVARTWDLRTGTLKFNLVGHSGAVNDVGYSPDGSIIATASEDATMRTWEAATGRERMRFFGHFDGVRTVRFSADGQSLITASQDQTAKVWDARATEAAVTIPGKFIVAGFNGEGSHVHSGDGGDEFKIWDSRTGRLLKSQRLERSVYPAWDALERRLFTDAARTGPIAAIWDLTSGQRVCSLEGHSQEVNSATFDRADRRVATVSSDQTVKVWNPETCALERSFDGTSRMNVASWSFDDEVLAAGGLDGRVSLWRAADGQRLGVVKAHAALITSIAFSRDGARVLTASSDQTASVWDARDGHTLLRLEGHRGWVMSAAFNPTESLIATSSHDGSIRIWDASTGEEVDRFVLGEQASRALFDPAGSRLLGVARSRMLIWPVVLNALPPGRVADFVRCHVPYRLTGEKSLVHVPTPADCQDMH